MGSHRAAGAGHAVVFVVFDGVKSLDVAGPAEVFAEANRFGASYRLLYVGPAAAVAMSSTGTPVAVTSTVEELPEVDTLVVCGGDVLVESPIDPALVRLVERLAPAAGRVLSICTASFVLAACGLLDGRRATTHWRHAELLSHAYPRIDVTPDELFVEDSGVFTSAGVSAGIDLALAIVERDHGVDVARSVARSLVVFLQRPGGQSQFSAPMRHRPPRAPTLRAVVEAVAAEPAADHSATKLAARVGVSPRQLSRMFRIEFGVTPARYVETVRLDVARTLLDQGHTVVRAAEDAGFNSSETMRRIFVNRLGVSPRQYRERFATTVGENPPDGVQIRGEAVWI